MEILERRFTSMLPALVGISYNERLDWDWFVFSGEGEGRPDKKYLK